MQHTLVIHLATDHAGFAHKEAVKVYLQEKGYDVHDHGATLLDPHDDYPDFIALATHAVSEDTESRGIIFGGSGQGEAMVANRTRGIRATVYYGGPLEIITLSREHNNANVLSIGARFISPEETIAVIKTWIDTPFSREPRHLQRIEKFN